MKPASPVDGLLLSKITSAEACGKSFVMNIKIEMEGLSEENSLKGQNKHKLENDKSEKKQKSSVVSNASIIG